MMRYIMRVNINLRHSLSFQTAKNDFNVQPLNYVISFHSYFCLQHFSSLDGPRGKCFCDAVRDSVDPAVWRASDTPRRNGASDTVQALA